MCHHKHYLDKSFTCHFRNRHAQLGHQQLQTAVYSDKLSFSNTTSICGNKCAQLFGTDRDWCQGVPNHQQVWSVWKIQFILFYCGHDPKPHINNAIEETGSQWDDMVCTKHLAQQRTTKPFAPWKNKAKQKNTRVKPLFRLIINWNKCPEGLWDYGMEYTSKVCEHLSRPSNEGHTPIETTTGETPDISELVEF